MPLNPSIFHSSYAESRGRFRDTASEYGWQLETIELPVAYRGDEVLATDVAYRGDANPEKLLVIVSGVHGVELMCGSGCQTALMAGDVLEKGASQAAVLMIHAINPWGAAHLRRTNESNIDLCRNCLDFLSPLPTNLAYAELHELLHIPELNPMLAAVRERITAPGGFETIQSLMAGQYSHPDGFNFGGHEQSWSTRTLLDILKRYGGQAGEVAIVELHSGLGNYAKGMIVSMQSGDALTRARRWFGPEIVAPRATGAAASGEPAHQAPGHTTDGYARILNQAQLTSVVLEFGTFAMERNFEALIKDHWVSCVAPADCGEARQIKQEMLHVHMPYDPSWHEAVIESSRAVVTRALRGLEQS